MVVVVGACDGVEEGFVAVVPVPVRVWGVEFVGEGFVEFVGGELFGFAGGAVDVGVPVAGGDVHFVEVPVEPFGDGVGVV